MKKEMLVRDTPRRPMVTGKLQEVTWASKVERWVGKKKNASRVGRGGNTCPLLLEGVSTHIRFRRTQRGQLADPGEGVQLHFTLEMRHARQVGID